MIKLFLFFLMLGLGMFLFGQTSEPNMCGTLTYHSEDKDSVAETVLKHATVHGGMLVHLNCGDGELTAALRALTEFTVQGLETDAEQVVQAREHIASRVPYGTVSFDLWDGQHLPYGDNQVNFLLTETLVDSDLKEEIMRVLVPGGVALVGTDRVWTKTVKPVPEEIDEWTHYLHGPGNNAVADDSVVGPPQHMQWVTGPRFARSHEFNSSLAAMVSSGGRIYYIWDESIIGVGDPRFPSRWSLVARDAFNGSLLWKRPMLEWGWRHWHSASRWKSSGQRYQMLRFLPPVLPRRLVADGDRLYITMAYDAPVSVLDGTTGKTIRVLEDTAPADEIIHAGNGILILSVRVPESDVHDLMPEGPLRSSIAAINSDNGEELWRSKPEVLAPLTLALQNDRIFYSTYEELVCRDLNNGKELWRNDSARSKRGGRNTAGTLVVYGGAVLYTPEEAGAPYQHGGAGRLHAFSVETGDLLWKTENMHYGPGISNPPDIFVVDGLVWGGDTRPRPDVDRAANVIRKGRDPVTGEVKRTVVVDKLISPGHHYRCYRSKAAGNYLLLPKRGVEFMDMVGDDHMQHDWLRAPCIYGVVPANGMLYVPSHQCVCYPGVLHDNFNALISHVGEDVGPPAPAKKDRLERGPAWGEESPEYTNAAGSGENWPTYRANVRRGGSIATSVTANNLEQQWHIEFDHIASPPVVTDGILLVAEKDGHMLHAVDAESGEPLWRHIVGGRIDSPPTVYKQKVLFGSADGKVYCLRLADGELVWRFMAAPRERRITAFGQFESAWPVHGSVLLQEDKTSETGRPVVYFMAGRSSFLDGGLWLYGLDPETGELIYEARLENERPDPHKDTGRSFSMDGAKSDILVSDGVDLYFYQERFRGDLTRLTDESPMQGNDGFRIYSSAPKRDTTGQRLITTSGFLDDTYAEGTFWTYDTRWPGWDRTISKVPSFGQLLVFDDRTTYGVNVFTERIQIRRGFTPGRDGYRLFARHHDETVDEWSVRVPVRIRAMVLAGDILFFAGNPDIVPDDDPLAALEGRKGGMLWAVSATNGEKLFEIPLDIPPVFDGLIAAGGRLYMSKIDGSVVCFGETDKIAGSH